MSAPRRLLIVDDEDDMRFLVRTMLAADYEIEEAAGGQQALDILDQRDDIDLVLLDIRMPDVDGIEVLERLSAADRLDGLRVVAFSADAEPARIDEILGHGVTDMVRKPFSLESLSAALERAAEQEEP